MDRAAFFVGLRMKRLVFLLLLSSTAFGQIMKPTSNIIMAGDSILGYFVTQTSLNAALANKQNAGTYLIPSDSVSNLKKRDTLWIARKDWASGQFQPVGTYLVPGDTSNLLTRFAAKVDKSDSGNVSASNISRGTLSAARLPSSGVSAGVYQYPEAVVIDQYGRATSISQGGTALGTAENQFRAGSQWKDNSILSTRYQEVLTSQDRTLPVVFIGNSLTNQIRTFVLRRIKEQYGFSGLGFDAFGNSGFDGWQSYMVKSAGWKTYSRNSSDEKWGISGTSLKGYIGDTLLYLPLTGYRAHTDARIWYLKKSGGGTFKLHTDGGVGVSINTNNATSRLAAYRVSGLDANTNHYFKIDSISVDSVTIYGIETFNSTTHGVAPYFLSVGGSTADEWAGHMSFFRAFYDSIAPVMTNIWLGANDAIAGTSAPDYKADITRILDTLQAIDTTGVVMWTHFAKGNNPIDGKADTAYWRLTGYYRDTLLALQSTRGISVWDVRNYMPSYEDGVRLNLYSDYIHQTFRGSNYLAQGVMQWLLPTEKRFYGLNRSNEDKWLFGEGTRADSTVNVAGTFGVTGSAGVTGRIMANYYMHGGATSTPDYMSGSMRLYPYSASSSSYSYIEARDDNELIDRNLVLRTQDGLGSGSGVSIKDFYFWSSGSMTVPGTLSSNTVSATADVLAGATVQVGTGLYVKGNWSVRNKADSGWNTWITRNTAGSDVALDLNYIGTAKTLSGDTLATRAYARSVGSFMVDTTGLSALNNGVPVYDHGTSTWKVEDGVRIGFTAPSSATDTGVKGEMRITSTYFYICTDTNVWRRVAISTWP